MLQNSLREFLSSYSDSNLWKYPSEIYISDLKSIWNFSVHDWSLVQLVCRFSTAILLVKKQQGSYPLSERHPKWNDVSIITVQILCLLKVKSICPFILSFRDFFILSFISWSSKKCFQVNSFFQWYFSKYSIIFPF